jgi:uncharacterized membrane protein/mono/diheme cytochrome c family protein
MKTWWLGPALSVALCAGFRPVVVHAQPTAPVPTIGNEVREVFATRCAACHGPKLAKPKGRFGYVLDLKRLAANPEMVIPYKPTESELWLLVERNEMPPTGSPGGSLTPEQKEIIRTWIASGAPEASLPAAESPPSVQPEQSAADRIVRWLGKFHLLFLHFPIALVVAAGLSEVLSVWQRNPLPSPSVRFCLWLGALAAVPTAGLGWLFAAAGNGVGSPQLLLAHRILGTITTVWLVFAACCAEGDARRGQRTRSVWFLLASGIILMAVTAHLGGLLAHGADFFSY